MQELQKLDLYARSDVKNHILRFIVCGKLYGLVLEEIVTDDYLIRSAEPGESIGDRHKKRQPFLADLQCSAVSFFGLVSVARCCLWGHYIQHQ